MSYISSAVIAAVVSAIVAFFTSERRIASENVIQERTKWRECIRELAEQIYKALVSRKPDANKELWAKLALRLNPHDPEDNEILDLVASNDAHRADEFIQRVSLLLKHDWERTTWESNLWLWASLKEPEPVEFHDFRPGDRKSYRRWRFRKDDEAGKGEDAQ
jgi:hypothetical protein